MKVALISVAAVALSLFAEGGTATYAQTVEPAPKIAWGMAMGNASGSPVQGAPYTSTITVKSVRVLADGNQIVQTSTGATARDSQGRTREEPPVPSDSRDMPHMVFLRDSVTYTAYALNLTDKTAHKMPSAESISGADGRQVAVRVMQAGDGPAGDVVLSAFPSTAARSDRTDTNSDATTEDLGSQTMEGLLVKGVRTTRTIPAGQVGNTEPIRIVTEVWTSPDLKTTVYSKRSDPVMGDTTFQLSNISRSEPDPSLFTVPSDFKIVDDPAEIFRQPKTQE